MRWVEQALCARTRTRMFMEARRTSVGSSCHSQPYSALFTELGSLVELGEHRFGYLASPGDPCLLSSEATGAHPALIWVLGI